MYIMYIRHTAQVRIHVAKQQTRNPFTVCKRNMEKIYQFVPISVKSIRSLYEVYICRNGAKAYIKNPRVFLREKSAKCGFKI